jgi:beta-glucosidase
MSKREPRLLVSRRKFLGVSAAVAGGATVVRQAAAQPAAAAPAGAAAAGQKRSAAGYPKDFVWGVATAAYQIEGAATEDGRGPSVWDVFSRKKGAVFEGHTGDTACDHYHRYKDDIALMKALGVKSYRFSVAWTRVLPQGTGAVNDKGLDFYSRLVDELLKNGIQPMCTVFHWDYPQALYQRGGWLNRDSADWFADYTKIVAAKLSDRVKVWCTQNEPQCFVGLALLEGVHAPGDKLKFTEYLTAGHNSMRAHGKCAQVLRAQDKNAKIGSVLAAQPKQPASEKAEDVAAARAATWNVADKGPWNNAWWTDPVVLGRYPEDGLALYGKEMPKFKDSDLDEMKQPLDFLGLNIYTADMYKQGADGKPEKVPFPPGFPRSGVDWQPIAPAALYWGPRHFYERYKIPITITESGLSTRDQVFLDGKVHDPQRVDYLNRVLLEIARAIRDGVPVNGYYAWSLLDNFEWHDGYKQRFGLVYVDYQNQKRIPKDSYHWYKTVIATNGKSLNGKVVMPTNRVTPL